MRWTENLMKRASPDVTLSFTWSVFRIRAPRKHANSSPSTANRHRKPIGVATRTGIDHFIYLSVAHPAPVMQSYIEVRAQCEASLRASGLNATFVRPWYVLGPGHHWPILLKPFYWAAE